MASNIRTFTITQARMGEPLQFQPALGSKELEDLVDAYVIGSASKQDKLSEVTLEFFNLAQVDIYTGLLTRHYTVTVSPNWTNLAFDQSPTHTQSSGFSPPMFTPSPASSMTFADSGYGSISMTPPTRSHGAPNRVTKKPKKDTKKTAEVRLPGFSIMTKDGVDVTSSAGRGTKTKEQREHAHLMRIMKACDECKRKKVRCDPSHRRPQTDMSRSSTSTTSSSHPKASPPVSVPSLSRATTQASPPELPSFGNNAIDDFVLFPEDNASWNPADMSLPEFDENLDLSQFNFDVSGLNDCPSITNTANQSFDFSFFDQQPATSFQLDHSLGHNPYVADQYGLDQWASAQGGDLSVSHTRPHHSISSQDSGQLDSSWFDSGLQSTESPGSQTTPSSLGMSEFAENFWPNGAVSHRQIAQSSSVSRPSAEADWSTLESGILPSPDGDFPSASMNRRDRRNMRVVERSRNAAIQQFVDSIPSAHADESPRAIVDAFDVQQPTGSSSPSTTDSIFDQPSSPGAATGGSLEYWGLESTCAFVAEATQALKSAPAAYQPIFEELQRLRGVLEVIKSGDTERTPVWQQAMVSELQILTSQLQVLFIRIKNTLRTSRVEESQRYNRLDPEVHPDYLQQCSVLTRRLVSALCATINCLKTQDIGTGGTYAATNSPILSSGNFQLTVAANSPTQTHPQDSDVYVPEGSYLSLSSGSSSLPGGAMNSALVRQELGKTTILDLRQGDRHDGAGWPTLCGAIGSGSVDIATIDKVSKYSLVTKPAFERLSRLVGEESSQTAILTGLERHSSALGQQETIFSALPFDTPTSSMGWWREAARLHQVQLFEQESSRIFDAPNLTPQIVNPHSEGGPTILPDRDHTFRPQLTAASLVTSVQNFGSPGSDSLSQQSEASSPGANPRTVLDNFATWHNRGTGRPADSFGVLANYIVMLTSLLLLNSLQANTLILILATLFLAVPHPTPAMITLIAMTVVIQATPISSLMSGLKYLVPAVIMSAPLFKNSLDGSLESVWSSSGGLLTLHELQKSLVLSYGR